MKTLPLKANNFAEFLSSLPTLPLTLPTTEIATSYEGSDSSSDKTLQKVFGILLVLLICYGAYHIYKGEFIMQKIEDTSDSLESIKTQLTLLTTFEILHPTITRY